MNKIKIIILCCFSFWSCNKSIERFRFDPSFKKKRVSYIYIPENSKKEYIGLKGYLLVSFTYPDSSVLYISNDDSYIPYNSENKDIIMDKESEVMLQDTSFEVNGQYSNGRYWSHNDYQYIILGYEHTSSKYKIEFDSAIRRYLLEYPKIRL